MEFLDARRLTGPNLLFDEPAAILDVCCDAAEADALVPVWMDHVARMLEALDWPSARFAFRRLRGGVSLAFTAPIDALYAATAINEWAWAASAHALGAGDAAPDFDATLADIRTAAAEEENVELMWLADEAAEHGATLLWDDDFVSLGLGTGSRTWPARQIPDAILWEHFHDIPVGIVTGTNGKTTTVRLAQHILRAGGHAVGVSSTDWISVDDRILDRGDWSGPGGARNVLRERDVEVAILETARGGLLRRGLAVQRAEAALITNISADHLGDFGSRDLDELLAIKWIVSRAVAASGKLVLNADDPRLVAQADGYTGEIVWFTLHPGNDVVTTRVAAGGTAFVVDDGQLCLLTAAGSRPLCAARDIPIALGGAAQHNVANALAAAALTWSLGATDAVIRAGLTTMRQEENPGRCNIYTLGERRIVVDFAHNPAAMRALFDIARALPARRRILCFGQAGDRPDELIRELARDAWSIGLDRVIVSELAVYHRGRGPGEVHAVIRDELLRLGAADADILHFDEELDSLQHAIDWAEPGDLVIMLALGGSRAVQERLKALGAE